MFTCWRSLNEAKKRKENQTKFHPPHSHRRTCHSSLVFPPLCYVSPFSPDASGSSLSSSAPCSTSLLDPPFAVALPGLHASPAQGRCCCCRRALGLSFCSSAALWLFPRRPPPPLHWKQTALMLRPCRRCCLLLPPLPRCHCLWWRYDGAFCELRCPHRHQNLIHKWEDQVRGYRCISMCIIICLNKYYLFEYYSGSSL